MSKKGSVSELRLYSPEEIRACLHFIKLPAPVISTSSSSNEVVSCPTIEWWPCFVFLNMLEFKTITQQLDLWSSLPHSQIMESYNKHFPASTTCRVALLMGEQAPPGNSVVQFDISTKSSTSAAASSFIVEPFLDKYIDFDSIYSSSEEYQKAVKQAMAEFLNASGSDTNSQQECEESKAAAPISCTPTIRTLDINENIGSDTNSQQECEGSKAVALLSCSPIIRTLDINENITSETKSQQQACEKSKVVVALSSSNERQDHVKKEKVCNVKKAAPQIIKNVEFVDIPTFKEVKGAMKKGGYTFNASKFCRPPFLLKATNGKSDVAMPSLCFNSIKELRNDLCAYGVNCRCGTSMDEEEACQCWTEDEKWNIKLWVRYNVIRGPIHKSSPVQVISLHQATKYLIRIGYNRGHLESPLFTGEQQNELFRYLSQYGLPIEGDEQALSCDYNAISAEERFSLEYFISTFHARVNTFTFTYPPIVESAPPTMTMEFDSPTPSSAVRPKRSAAMRQQRNHGSGKKPKVTHDEGGATIISVESNVSVISNSDTPRKSVVKKNSNRKSKETPKDRKTDSSESPPSQPVEMDKSDDIASYRSPILRSSISLTKEDNPVVKHLPQQRVSLSPASPPLKFEEVPVPVFEGSDHHKLLSCLDSLKLSNCANLPTICPSNETINNASKFATNIRKVSNFLQAVLTSRGRNGTGKINEESSAALYVCGAPGLGKTSGVHWCCNHIAESTLDNDVRIKICHLNASYLTAQSKPLRLVIKEIATCMGIKAQCLSESTITKKIADRKNSTVLIVVVDEIDAFVTGSGRASPGTECLKTLLRWANKPTMQMGLIGISNCMNDLKTRDILELGQFVETTTFSPYSEYELQKILLARVGTTVIAPNVIDYIAKKVATSSGDARKALEMAANAVQHRIDQFQGSTSGSTDGHLVKMPNVIQANKEEILNLRDRIAGLPAVGKVILCILTAYAQAGGAIKTTIGELKQCVSECMRQTGMEDEMVQMDDFLVLLETLVDSGLLRASLSTTNTSNGNGLNLSQRTLSDVHRQPIYLGIQLDDIEKVLESDLTQTFYQNLRERARLRRHDE